MENWTLTSSSSDKRAVLMKNDTEIRCESKGSYPDP
jgi:hypothetical protein